MAGEALLIDNILIILAIALSLLGIFGLARLIGIPILIDPMPWLERGGSLAALITTGLLTIDVLDHIIIGDKKYLSLKREGLF